MNLERFVSAQEHSYAAALQEIRSGQKTGHWMWYIFPQLQGLGLSEASRYYAIRDLQEAERYLKHPVLGPRLQEISIALLGLPGTDPRRIFGSIDAMKLRSSMTLFYQASHFFVFHKVLVKFFGGEADPLTLQLLEQQAAAAASSAQCTVSEISCSLPKLPMYSPGFATVTAPAQIRQGVASNAVTCEKKIHVVSGSTGKWFCLSDNWENDSIPTAMMGAACGDVAGSIYERHNIKYKPDPDHLIPPTASFTDDTVMTCAVAEGLRVGLGQLPRNWMAHPEGETILLQSLQRSLLRLGRQYPHAGYGGSFRRWLASTSPKPYNSWGNGSAMRASYAGWVAGTLEEAEKLAELSAMVTHNHPEGVKGAVVVAGAIFLLRCGKSKQDVADYAGKFYDLNFTLDEIRKDYRFDVSCAGSVPQAIRAFLEEDSFVNVISAAISIGGDSDTIAAIAGSIAEVIYPIPQMLRSKVIDRMDSHLLSIIEEAVDFAWYRQSDAAGKEVFTV